MTNAILNPDQAAALMRKWLPTGVYPGAPGSGPALLARTHRSTAPRGHLVKNGNISVTRYDSEEVVAYCLELQPPLVRRGIDVLHAAEALQASALEVDADGDLDGRLLGQALNRILVEILGDESPGHAFNGSDTERPARG